ncbi:deoxycytidylate deaminase [Desulfurivibrio alkaliphilus]|uniref:CMP/dCMP deaminase zinc-binding protein n=1 Tax=Desulfurivibrio alkaliphilus (strain DSM 19089 / UNIQEM U267 / AHT2) TaxID=589865 RepID=D6Z351_DESAT|nr:cytidine/deoxycytidylate deaminase family protein [Desulfurivibrio alkaliphilus]ADH85976.1 CMP/dCMP deaminase zinc-binding protein [Desulfurivibrio alkaliphilus AHT 2]
MPKELARPSWEEYFMAITDLVAQRATCVRRKVGAILVRDRRIVATGYNGAPSGIRHCLEVGCLREELAVPSGERHELCRGLHAEQNAIIQAALHGVSLQSSMLFCTNMPCSICSKMLINAGITKIYYREGYADSMAAEMLSEAGVPLVQVAADEGQDR